MKSVCSSNYTQVYVVTSDRHPFMAGAAAVAACLILRAIKINVMNNSV